MREIVVFIPNDRPGDISPMQVAHSLIKSLGVEHAAFGTDILTGHVEVRLPFDPGILAAARRLLADLDIPFEIEAR